MVICFVVERLEEFLLVRRSFNEGVWDGLKHFMATVVASHPCTAITIFSKNNPELHKELTDEVSDTTKAS